MSKLFTQTVDTICAEVKKQFLNGAERIVLTRDGDAIWCEPDYKTNEGKAIDEGRMQ